jgi:8-oxo-dGTP pyrophosphatase MutT (NUDIX family)
MSSDKPGAKQCQDKMTCFAKNLEFFFLGRLFLARKDHVAGFLAALAAVVQIEGKIILEDVVAGGKAEFPGGAVDGGGRTLQFGKRADRRLVNLD